MPCNEKDCTNCGNGMYLGEGDICCGTELVLDDFCPTEHFMNCEGRDWCEN